jgi:hypothetical protein
MQFPNKWQSDAADISREETKREQSPSSFFFSQGQALKLAAGYFADDRLTQTARGGVATKHRHRIHLALFGQMMAALEFLFKDFIASVVDLIPTFDDKLVEAKWIEVDAKRILSFRSAASTPGALLLHPTQGWHDPESVNRRYSNIFQRAPITTAEIPDLERLWILRHSVAHNAGFVTTYDSVRMGLPGLGESVVDLDAEFIGQTFDFLCVIAERVAIDVGGSVVNAWLRGRTEAGKDYNRDRNIYQALKLLATYVPSRAQALPTFTKGAYTEDFTKATAV